MSATLKNVKFFILFFFLILCFCIVSCFFLWYTNIFKRPAIFSSLLPKTDSFGGQTKDCFPTESLSLFFPLSQSDLIDLGKDSWGCSWESAARSMWGLDRMWMSQTKTFQVSVGLNKRVLFWSSLISFNYTLWSIKCLSWTFFFYFSASLTTNMWSMLVIPFIYSFIHSNSLIGTCHG